MAGKEVPADGVVTGAAAVDGRLIHLASQDFTVLGGSAGEVHSHKVADVMELALHNGSPFVFINDSGGARVQEGIDSLSGYGRVFYTNVMLSGAVPQISLICGPCAGGAAYSPALTDFIIQTRQAQMFITGPAGHQAGDRRADHRRGAGRPRRPHGPLRRHPLHRRERPGGPLPLPPPPQLPALEQPRRPAPLAFENNVDPNPELNAVVPVEPKQGYDVRKVICGTSSTAATSWRCRPATP